MRVPLVSHIRARHDVGDLEALSDLRVREHGRFSLILDITTLLAIVRIDVEPLLHKFAVVPVQLELMFGASLRAQAESQVLIQVEVRVAVARYLMHAHEAICHATVQVGAELYLVAARSNELAR